MMADMHDQSHFYQAVVNSVAHPSPENIRSLHDIAPVENIGLAEAAKVRQGLLALLENPSDSELNKSQDDVEAARVKVLEARELLDKARLALDEAEAEHVNQQQVQRVANSRRHTADRALENPNVKRAWALLGEDKETTE